MLDDISLYWFTKTGTSSSRSYWEVWGRSPFDAVEISIPVAVTIFPGEIYRAPRSWAEQNFHNLIYWNEVDKGGHFAAWEHSGTLRYRDPSGVQIAALTLVDRANTVFAPGGGVIRCVHR